MIIEDYIQVLIYGILGGFSVSAIVSLLGYGIYKALNMIERS